MAELTARLTDEGWRTLHRLSRDHGLTLRGIIEGCGTCLLDLEERAKRRGSPEIDRRLLVAVWDAARRMDDRAATGELDRKKFNVRVEDSLFAAVKKTCAANGVSLTGLMTIPFEPWGSGWTDDGDLYAARGRLWESIAETARGIDFERRSGVADDCGG